MCLRVLGTVPRPRRRWIYFRQRVRQQAARIFIGRAPFEAYVTVATEYELPWDRYDANGLPGYNHIRPCLLAVFFIDARHGPTITCTKGHHHCHHWYHQSCMTWYSCHYSHNGKKRHHHSGITITLDWIPSITYCTPRCSYEVSAAGCWMAHCFAIIITLDGIPSSSQKVHVYKTYSS